MKKITRFILLFTGVTLVLLALCACGPEHVHDYGEWTTVREPTCNETGLMKRSCSCGEVMEMNEIPKTEHTYGDSLIEKPATFYDEGVSYCICKTCGEIKREVVEKRIGDYYFVYESLDNNTCEIVSLYINPNADIAHLVIPASSPDGENVIGISSCLCKEMGTYTDATLPTLIQKDDFANYILKPLENASDFLYHKILSFYALDTVNGQECYQLSPIATSYEKNTLKQILEQYCPGYKTIGICVCGYKHNLVKITDITISDGIQYIGENAFNCFTELTSVVIPESVTNIGGRAFYGCAQLKSIDIPSNIKIIENDTFSNCYGLTNIDIPYGVTSIGSRAFSNCDSLTSVTIPSSVTSIGSYAFSGCNSLTSVLIPDSVTVISDYAFSYCNALAGITIPDSITVIGDYAFSDCYSLTSITIPNSVTSIDSNPFRNCSSLESIIVDENHPVYHCAGNCLINIETKTLIAGYKNSVIPKASSVTSVGDYAFYNCAALTSIPSSVISIGNGAFYGCDALTSITFSDKITSIGKYTFAYCRNIGSISIPNSVTCIGERAFYTCKAKQITYLGTIEQWQAITKGDAWSYASVIHCSNGDVTIN